jgi:hypothetical protein
MHDRQSSDSGFIFDLMEPKRPKVDRAVLDFVKANALHPADLTIRTDGVCRLNPELTRRLVQLVTAPPVAGLSSTNMITQCPLAIS